MRTLLVLSLSTASFALAMSSVIPALGALIDEFSTDTAGVAWVLTAFLVSAAVTTPILGRLGDMFGKRRMLVCALGVFVAGSVVAALAPSLEVLVAGRVLQGLGGGIFPLCFGIIRDEFPPERVPVSIAVISTIGGIGASIGIVGGGLLAEHVSYHWLFWTGAITSSVAAVAALLLVPESPVRQPGRVDWRGAAVLAVGLVLPLTAVGRATDWGWTDPRVVGLASAGLVVLVLWSRLQQRTAEPLADVATLRSPPVLVTNIATFLFGFGMFGSFILVPQLAETPIASGGLGYDATGAGLVLLPGSLVSLVTGPLGGQIAARVGSRVPLVIGGVLTTVGLGLLGFAHGELWQIIAASVVVFAGIGFAFASMPNLIIAAVPSERTGEATGFNSLVRMAGSSLGSQVAASILAGSAVAGATVPSDSGFTTAFLVSAGVAALATLCAFVVPPPGSRAPSAVRVTLSRA